MKLIDGNDCELGLLDNETDDKNMYQYFKRVAKKTGANLDYCYIIEFDGTKPTPKFRKNEIFEYFDGELYGNYCYLAKGYNMILVYEM